MIRHPNILWCLIPCHIGSPWLVVIVNSSCMAWKELKLWLVTNLLDLVHLSARDKFKFHFCRDANPASSGPLLVLTFLLGTVAILVTSRIDQFCCVKDQSPESDCSLVSQSNSLSSLSSSWDLITRFDLTVIAPSNLIWDLIPSCQAPFYTMFWYLVIFDRIIPNSVKQIDYLNGSDDHSHGE